MHDAYLNFPVSFIFFLTKTEMNGGSKNKSVSRLRSNLLRSFWKQTAVAID